MPVKMTRAEYEKKYGATSSTTPVKMTRAEYEKKYGQPSFGQKLARSLFNAPAKLGATAATAISSGAALLGSEKANQTTQKLLQDGAPLPYIGNVKPIQNPLEAAGVGAEVASFVTPATRLPGIARSFLKGKKLLPLAESALTGAVSGAQFGAGTALQEPDPTAKSVTRSALRDSALGAAGGAVLGSLPLAPAALRAVGPKAPAPSEAAAQIVRAGSKAKPTRRDVKLALDVLPQLDTSNVKNFKDLSDLLDTTISTKRKTVDELVSFDQTVRPLDQLTTKVTSGELSAEANYVRDALQQLKQNYVATNDLKASLEIDTLLKKAETEGLTTAEINTIARRHGTDLSAFNPTTGQLASGLTKQAAENTRKGLKSLVRKFAPKTEEVDKRMAQLLRLKKIVDEADQAAENLRARVTKRSVLQKAGRFTGNAIDMLTGGFLRGAVASVFQSGYGRKTLDALGLEDELAKNLRALRFLEKAPDEVLDGLLRSLNNMGR